MREYSNFYAALFQFHKGTIRTLFALIKQQYTLKFQFHKGTIRTCFECRNVLRSEISIP